ncbi:poly-gamma-glutamate hydrolase family protein [Mycolicibacterium bacteremicum]|uniref:poly-gamma-glutamate hydrolase family protein n=1 Tax=Mycolicibacterium bacteremicum TaxID=564198 RepID=UPI0026F22894|nr:poly-gamma-glutamate hydrolase family protein [Mycolicibacterium bacteremicum]
MAGHLYFAYGSNLCVDQMALRCPDADDPVPATLADHDWLINERGVATVEPADGAEVHGVLWRISDADLAVLDRAEGVPVRYRRDLRTVHTDAGSREAWIYIDHRTEAGAPRPGYLDRVIAGATQHRLPQRWLDFLHRWDPVHWPRALAPTDTPGPQTLTELLSDPQISETSMLRSTFGFMAIHGGGLERMTDVIAERAAAAAGASVYLVRHPADYPYHLSSAAYRAAESERLAEFLDHVEHVVSLHGYGRVGRSTQLLAGGTDRELAAHVAGHLSIPAHQVITDLEAIPRELRGLHPDNPVNRTRGGGVQLELAPRVRGISPRSGPVGADGLSRPTGALIAGLVSAAQTWRPI